MRRLLLTLVLATFIVTITGCGSSHKTQTIETNDNGSLVGVQLIPRDGDRDVHVNTWIRVYWPAGYEPPAQFTFKLRAYQSAFVSTYEHESNQRNDWQFEPASELSYNTRYVAEIEAGDESVNVTFWTEGEEEYAHPSNTSHDAGPRVSDALEEHKVQTVR